MRKDDIVSDIMNKRQAKSITNKVVLKLREARGEISQYKLAKGTGMSESSISKIECRKQNPSFMTLAIIAEYLGCYFPEIVAQCYPPKEDRQAMDLLGHSPLFDMTVEDLKKLSEDDLVIAHSLVSTLAKRKNR